MTISKIMMKCLLCNKIEYAVFNNKNITEKYYALVSEGEIVKARKLVTD